MQPRNGPGRPRRGIVISFDEQRGLGSIEEIESAHGGRYPFHCTAIADGTRHILPGTRVVFVIGPGHLGRFEAMAISPVER